MSEAVVGVGIGVAGLLLSAWSIWYARRQAKLMQNIQRNELISLWASLDRIRTLLWAIRTIAADDNFVENAVLTPSQVLVIPSVHKGIADEYVRTAEMIVKKTPDVSRQMVDDWEKRGTLRNPWQKQLFVDLIPSVVGEQPQSVE